MAKVCTICQRKAVTGHSRSHSNIATKRRMSINLQYKKIKGEKRMVCTSCLRNISKKLKSAALA